LKADGEMKAENNILGHTLIW